MAMQIPTATMPRYDFHSPRLYVEAALMSGHTLELDSAQANYLRNVLRLKAGASVLVFNGRDGEWRATLADRGKRALSLSIGEQTRTQTTPLDLHFLFAPLKHARLDYMVQKAVEMGAARLQPVLTRHTQVTRVNAERMQANAIEATSRWINQRPPDGSHENPHILYDRFNIDFVTNRFSGRSQVRDDDSHLST